MRVRDVIIIGGGVVGAAAARELSRYRLDIALLEKEEELAFGVSKSNSGIIHPGTQNPAGSLKGRLCVRGNFLTRKISRELGVDFREVGELIVAFDEREIERLYDLKKEAQRLGVPGLKIVDSKWLRKNEPNLNKEARAALYAPTAAVVSPYRLVYDSAENAVRNGVEIYNLAKVDAISRRDQDFEVFTSRGAYSAKFIINAAGLYADEISKMAGASDFTIKPRKGEEFLLDKKLAYLTNHLIFPLPSLHSKGILVIKTSDGNPMIGPTAEEVSDKEEISTSDEGLKKVLAAAQRLIPSISADDIIAYFAGLRPAAGDDFIIRHEKSIPGFVNIAGIQSPGLTCAFAIAGLVIDILKKNGLTLKKRLLFHRGRRKTLHLFSMPQRTAERVIKKDPSYGDIVCRCEMVSAKEVRDAVKRGARTMDGIKFRTRAQAGRCHGTFCTMRIMKILAEETQRPLTAVTKRGPGSEIIKGERAHG